MLECVTITPSQLPVAMRLNRPRPLRRLEILLSRDKNVRSRIQREQLRGELREHVIGHDEHRLGTPDPAASTRSPPRPSCRSCPRRRRARAACCRSARSARWHSSGAARSVICWLLAGSVRWLPLKTRSRTLLKSSLYLRQSRSRRSSSSHTHDLKRSLIFSILSRAASVCCAIDDRRIGLRVGVIDRRRFEIERVLNQLDGRVTRRAPLRRVRDGGARVVVARG